VVSVRKRLLRRCCYVDAHDGDAVTRIAGKNCISFVEPSVACWSWGLPRPVCSRRVLQALWGLWFDFSGVNGSSGGGVSVAASGPLNLGTRLTVSGFTGIGNSVTGGMH
jgi:hypothetical protein